MTDPDVAKKWFDSIARRSNVNRMTPSELNRYVAPKHPHLFAKEMMFSLAGDVRGKRVLEIGCGEGVAAVQLAHCGADVCGMDISPVSIEVARTRARLQGLTVTFVAGDITAEEPPFDEQFDVVWCDLVLHHVVGFLDVVLHRIAGQLRPGGLFIAREPVAYAGWLKGLRKALPVVHHETPDGQPLRTEDFEAIRHTFPQMRQRYFRVMARADALTGHMFVVRQLARLDSLLLRVPGAESLAGHVVLWARRPESDSL